MEEEMQTGETGGPRSDPDLARWKAAFADESGQQFSEIVAVDAVLDGSVFAHPITGRDAIWSVLQLSGSLYDRLEFTHEVVSADRTYLEWEARALGLQVWGVTALTKGAEGRITRIALHHRPLGAVIRFSTGLADRLTAIVNANGVTSTDRTT
jgi:hypothetical protein